MNLVPESSNQEKAVKRLSKLLRKLKDIITEGERGTGGGESRAIIEQILVRNFEYYKNLFTERDGKLMFHCPKPIQSSRAFKNASLGQIFEAALHYGINLDKEGYLFWLARAAVAMPLPSRAWSKKIDDETHNVKYSTTECNNDFYFHPADPFLFQYISLVR